LEELAESFREPLQLLLMVVAVLSAVFGELRDAAAIAAVIVAVALTETITEQRAGRAIAALKRLSAPTARIRRPAASPAGPGPSRVGGEGAVVEVPAAQLVAGDVIVVEAGDLIPADARVLSGQGLRADESSLTGEAVPSAKGPAPVQDGADLAERSSMLYAGTAVTSGEGTAVVVATGGATELGRLGTMVAQEREPATPLQQALAALARAILFAAIAASVLVPLIGLARGQNIRDMLLAGLTLAFATIPEELPILITVLLAVGGRQLARRGALLRRLRAGETLGVVTTVVTDKTGTLTENQLRLAEIRGDRTQVLAVALAAQPPHTAQAGQAGREPLESDLAGAARADGITVTGRLVAGFPFDPAIKLTSRVRDIPGRGLEVAVAGAPEAVLAACALPGGQREAVLAELDVLFRKGLRVIAFARRTLTHTPATRDDAETDLTYVGAAAFDDPVRTGVPAAVAELRRAGVATIVVSGDHPATVAAIGRRAGLTTSAGSSHRSGGEVLTGGAALQATPDPGLALKLVDGTVVGRATPADKLRIVRLLQERGQVVAVTGDGVNDAPALAAADVGIAMGRRGSDLARQAADLVLTDDSYPTVAAAVAKGRNIGSQLRRAVAFYLGAKAALVTVMLVALAAGLPVVFTPAAIVLLELFMDLGASVAFVAEPAAPGAMHHPPRLARAGFLDRPTLGALAVTAAALTTAVLPAYLLLRDDPGVARSAAVLAWLAGHALIAWTLRARPALPWRRNFAFPAWAAAAIVAGLAVTTTHAGDLIHLTPLTGHAAVVVAACVAVAVLVAAIGRWLLHLGSRL
jgi:P-type Ca2+ transporter type 2C